MFGEGNSGFIDGEAEVVDGFGNGFKTDVNHV